MAFVSYSATIVVERLETDDLRFLAGQGWAITNAADLGGGQTRFTLSNNAPHDQKMPRLRERFGTAVS